MRNENNGRNPILNFWPERAERLQNECGALGLSDLAKHVRIKLEPDSTSCLQTFVESLHNFVGFKVEEMGRTVDISAGGGNFSSILCICSRHFHLCR